MDENRLKHSLAVARKMMNIAKDLNLKEKEINDCFIIGFNHDIGYEFSKKGVNHGKIGGLILKNMGFKYWKEIYYHGIADSDYKSLYLTILNMADMQIDSSGNEVGYKKRLKDIELRYTKDSHIYKNCQKLIEKLEVIE